MEKRRKICQDHSNCFEDRLSCLPDHLLLDGIIRLLPIRDLIKLSSVSKKFQEMCLCSPSLTVDIPYPPTKATTIQKAEPSILRFLDKSISPLTRHSDQGNHNRLRLLRINWSLHRFAYVPWLHAFLGKALSLGGLEHLSLNLSSTLHRRCSTFELGPQIDSPICTSLKHLSLNFHNMTLLILPVTAPVFPNLQFLRLRDLKITHESFYHQLSAFNFLKQLVIEGVHGVSNICISSSSLEFFTFEVASEDNDLSDSELISSLRICGDKLNYIYIKWYSNKYASHRKDSLQIIAPNLKRVLWENGIYVDDPSFRNLPRLEAACLYFTSPVGTRDSYPNTPELFHSLGNVNHLYLTDWNLKALCSHDCRAVPVSAVSKLGLYIQEFRNEVVLDLMQLLGRIPRLNILYIACCYTSVKHAKSKHASGCYKKLWESHKRLDFIDTLEEVCIQIFTGDNELHLARYLLKHGKALKQLVICESSPLQPDAVTKLNRFRRSVRLLGPATRRKVIFRGPSYFRTLPNPFLVNLYST